MNLSVEISMYPLQDGYIPKIDDFLDDINQHGEGIDIRTSNMSTRLFGEYQLVSTLLSEAMQRSMQKHGKVVFVCKFIEGDARELESLETVTVK
ncbi:MAG: hypothetical protein KTR16_03695 [Acidiferrobacterales bacterium]|nr:hypothetical protein [Acidiferrobacterales bacterium]